MIQAKDKFRRRFLYAAILLAVAVLLYHAPKVAGAIPLF